MITVPLTRFSPLHHVSFLLPACTLTFRAPDGTVGFTVPRLLRSTVRTSSWVPLYSRALTTPHDLGAARLRLRHGRVVLTYLGPAHSHLCTRWFTHL